MENEIIPIQVKGSQLDVKSEVILESIDEAINCYGIAKQKLFDVNNWEKVCGTTSTCFQLTDENGQIVNDMAEGRLIRIDIPGPGTAAGDGYDWVRIEKIADHSDGDIDEWVGFTVRPCANPNHVELGVAHFFSDNATSTFLVKRSGQKVVAEVHGRNELPNENIEGVFDGLRNAMVGYSAKLGLSYPQWKLLVEGLAKKPD